MAGHDQVLWLVVGRLDPQEEAFFHFFAVMEKTSPQPRAVTYIVPQKGTISHLAAAGTDLHVFFGRDAHFLEEAAHYRYDRSGGQRDLSLPGPAMPLALAGEASGDRPRLWAVVTASTARAVQAEWERARQGAATQPVGSAAASSPETASSAADAPPSPDGQAAVAPQTLHLVSYDGMHWQPAFPATEACAASERLWLAPGRHRLHLFWQVHPDDREVHYAWHENDLWVTGPTLQLDEPPLEAFAGVMNARLVFAASSPADGARQRRLRLWAWQSGSEPTDPASRGVWTRLPALQSAGGKELLLPAGAALGAFADKLVVLRQGERAAEFAMFSPLTGGPPDRPFEEVPLAGAGGVSKTQRSVRDLVATLVVAAVLLLVFWRRQESIAAAIPLPPGLVLAGLGKRFVAALIDMIPAAAVANVFWHEPIRQFLRESQAAVAAGRSELLAVPPPVVWAWLCFVLVYTGYCIVFEAWRQTTPGKRLMRCEVRLEDFGRPGTVRVFVRNLTKIVELMPYLQIWPFLLVVLFTRNHQRVGDLLARTLVVERQRMVAGNEDDFDDSSDPE